MRSIAADEPGWATFVVEHYWPGVTPDAFQAVAAAVRAAADELGRDGLGVRFLHSTLVVSDEAAYCVLTALTRHEVELVYEAAGVGYERLLDAVECGGALDERTGTDCHGVAVVGILSATGQGPSATSTV